MSKQKFLFICAVCCVISISWYMSSVVSAQSSRTEDWDAAVKLALEHPVPVLTVTFEERIGKAGSDKILARRGKRGWRKDGSSVEQYTNNPGGTSEYSVRDIVLSPNISATVFDDVRGFTARKISVQPHDADPNRLNPATGCASNFFGQVQFIKSGPDQTFLGYTALALRQVASGKTISHEFLMVPSLGCLKVRRMTSFRGPDGSVTDTSENIVTGIELKEPPAQLLLVPKDYQQDRLSSLLAANWKKKGVSIPDDQLAHFKQQDELISKNPVDSTPLREP